MAIASGYTEGARLLPLEGHMSKKRSVSVLVAAVLAAGIAVKVEFPAARVEVLIGPLAAGR